MSFRSITHLNIKRDDVKKDIADRNLMHKRLMSLFPDGLGDNPRQAINLIYAVNPINGRLIIQSDMIPDFSALCHPNNQYFLSADTDSTNQQNNQFDTGDIVSFQLWFAAQERETGSTKRVNIADNAKVESKASMVLARHGLEVQDIQVVERQAIGSTMRKVSYENAELTGSGVVTDAIQLRNAVVTGIGAGRLWGSGVLLITV